MYRDIKKGYKIKNWDGKITIFQRKREQESTLADKTLREIRNRRTRYHASRKQGSTQETARLPTFQRKQEEGSTQEMVGFAKVGIDAGDGRLRESRDRRSRGVAFFKSRKRYRRRRWVEDPFWFDKWVTWLPFF